MYNNESYLRGAGIFVYDCYPTLTNNTVVNNRCTSEYGNGGGIYSNSAAEYRGENNIVWGNEASYNPQMAGNANFNYSCVPFILPGTGNIMDDPLFLDPESGDFHLDGLSPCIDSGDPESPLDPDSTRADMGTYYYHQALDVNPVNILSIPTRLSLTAYPNPFNSSSVISFNLVQGTEVDLSIYDIAGRRIMVLAQGDLLPGTYTLPCAFTQQTSGVYFLTLKTQDRLAVTKLILVE